jgi:hypothetical protein
LAKTGKSFTLFLQDNFLKAVTLADAKKDWSLHAEAFEKFLSSRNANRKKASL